MVLPYLSLVKKFTTANNDFVRSVSYTSLLVHWFWLALVVVAAVVV